jgi:hypothetical protein
VQHRFEIDDEIKALLPQHSTEELSHLRSLLVARDKPVDPLTVLEIENEGKKVLGDGHTREIFCREEGIPFSTVLVKVPDRAAAIDWVIRNQLGRRNLTDEMRDYFIGKRYLNERQGHGGERKPEGASAQNEHLLKTSERIAEEEGVSAATVKRNAAFAEAVDTIAETQGEAAKQAVLSGQSGQTKAETTAGKKLVLCERCIRTAPGIGIPDCAACIALRAKAKRDRKKARRKKKAEKGAQPTEVQDAFKNPVPKKRLAAWQDPWIQETFDTLAVALDNLLGARMAAGMNKRAKHYPFFDAKDFCDGYGFATNYIDQLIQHLKELRPAGVCPCCAGKGCGDCRNAGLVPRAVYEKLVKKVKS